MIHQVTHWAENGLNERKIREIVEKEGVFVKFVGYREVYVIKGPQVLSGYGKEPVRIEIGYSELIKMILSRGNKVGGFGYSKGYEPNVGEAVVGLAMGAVQSGLSRDDFVYVCLFLHYSNLACGDLGRIEKGGWHRLKMRKSLDNCYGMKRRSC